MRHLEGLFSIDLQWQRVANRKSAPTAPSGSDSFSNDSEARPGAPGSELRSSPFPIPRARTRRHSTSNRVSGVRQGLGGCVHGSGMQGRRGLVRGASGERQGGDVTGQGKARQDAAAIPARARRGRQAQCRRSYQCGSCHRAALHTGPSCRGGAQQVQTTAAAMSPKQSRA